MLVWTAGDSASLGYIDPRDLASRFDVQEQGAILDQMAVLLNDIAAQAAGA
jgi:hypothetical protein